MSPLNLLSTIAASLTATGCALLLLRRGPTRRLKLLTLSVGLMSLSQSVMMYQIGAECNAGGGVYVNSHHLLISVLSLLSIYLLGSEIYDRNFVNKRLRLAEADVRQRPDVREALQECAAPLAEPVAKT